MVAGIVPLVILAGLADWLFHLDVFVRAALFVLVTCTALWTIYRRVVRPLIVRFADLDIALRIEQRWPGLHDRLASTIQFLRVSPGDQRYGSPTLREATIKQAIDETRSIDFREVIEYKPIVRAAALAAAAASLGLLLGLAAPSSSRTALRRLFLPWAGDRWPQQTHLALAQTGTTLKIARGDSFTLSVQVRPGDRIPESAYVTYNFADGEEVVEPLRATEGGEFHGRLDTVNQPFQFSVAGGDDSSSVRDVEVKVVPPPALNRLTVRLVSPKYTGIPTQTLAAGLTSFRVLEGTKIELDAQANKPLASALLHLGDQAAAGSVSFNPARTGFKAEFPVKNNVAFWFDFKDDEGFRNREAARYDVRMFKDEPPRVVIAEPKTDRDVPSDAVIPVRIELDDDFGLHSARLMYKVATGESEPHDAVAIPLWSAPGEEAGSAQPSFVKHKEIEYVWKLEPLKLGIGSIITFYADSRDFDSIKGPNLGKSRELRLRIVSREDAARQSDDARRELREEISRILAMQRQAITPVDEATRTLARSDRLPRSQREDLKNAGLIQHQVGSRMNNRDEGLEQKLRHLLDDLRNFKIAKPDAEQQMQNMLERLGMLRDHHLEPAEQGLTRAGKSIEQIPEAPADGQQGTKGTKDETASPDRAEQGSTKDQKAPGEQGSQERAAPGKPPGETGKPQSEAKRGSTAAQKDQAGQQRDGSDRGQASERPAQPPAAKPEPGSSPLDNAKRSLAEAKTNQKAIADELQKMLDNLSEFETYRGVVKDAQNLLKKQEEALKQSAEAATKPDLMGKSAESLSPEQKAELGNMAARQSEVAKGLQNLQERMGELAKRLEESDPLGASAMRDAAGNSQKQGTTAKMGEAAEQLEKNQMGQARSRQEAARQELRELVDSVQNRRERELSRLVKELKKAESDLRDLRKRQAETLKATREAKKNPNAQERKSQLRKLAKQQAQIQQELKRQLQRLAKLSADAAGRAASDAEARMAKAQGQLDDDQCDQADKNEEEALADLNDAQDELENVRKEAEERLAMEQLARMGDQLKSLAQRQGKMVTDTEGYENLRRQSGGKFTIAQRTGVRGLGQVQSGIKDETAGLTEQLEGAPVFSLTLRRAAENMQTAAERLAGLKTDEETQRAVRSAAHRFDQLIDALKADSAKQGGQGGGGGGGGGDGGGRGGGDGIPATAQLKMLKTLQQELNERTEQFDELSRRNQKLTPEQAKEAEQLSTDQGSLADLVRDLTRPKRDDGEE
jgi:hypothetical protein